MIKRTFGRATAARGRRPRIVLEPEVLLLDETLSNLDAKLRRHVREEIRQIQQELGLTAVYVTHDQEEAMAVSDEIVVMKNVETAQVGTPLDLYERPSSAFIADFIGDANLVSCEITGQNGSETSIRAEDRVVNVPGTYDIKGGLQIVLIPHKISVLKSQTPGSFPAAVTYIVYLGNQILYTVEGPLGHLFVTSSVTDCPAKMGGRSL
jgi:iron(III) transport system ATP-binding protein